jgi:argininosuccinate lyase
MAGLYSGWNRAWVAAIGVLMMTVPAAAQQHDPFYWLGEINKASAVMVVERGIVPKELGSRIADAVRQVTAAGDRPGAVRSGNYLVIEDTLIKIGGPDMTRLHSGRSRQDIGATIQRLAMRDDLLDAFDRLNVVRAALLGLAQKYPNAIIPAYTWGVQAQPITLGHYLAAYLSAFARDAERVREAYARINLSPLGAAALGTSSFPVDRPRLAQLLGFDGVVENSLDAN